jgi:hypothetical protein
MMLLSAQTKAKTKAEQNKPANQKGKTNQNKKYCRNKEPAKTLSIRTIGLTKIPRASDINVVEKLIICVKV